MATHLKQTGWSYSEFARLPSDGNRYEVIAGELHVTPAPRPIHQFVLHELSSTLRNFVTQHELGWVFPAPIDLLFGDGDYVQPDIIFVRRERRGIITDRGIEGPPDLIVEITSVSTAERDRGAKREQYAYFGVPLYWIVDPDARRVEVYHLQQDPARPTITTDSLEWTPVVEGPTLSIPLPEIFRGFE